MDQLAAQSSFVSRLPFWVLDLIARCQPAHQWFECASLLPTHHHHLCLPGISSAPLIVSGGNCRPSFLDQLVTRICFRFYFVHSQPGRQWLNVLQATPPHSIRCFRSESCWFVLTFCLCCHELKVLTSNLARLVYCLPLCNLALYVMPDMTSTLRQRTLCIGLCSPV